jgi:hypothetical protein
MEKLLKLSKSFKMGVERNLKTFKVTNILSILLNFKIILKYNIFYCILKVFDLSF